MIHWLACVSGLRVCNRLLDLVRPPWNNAPRFRSALWSLTMKVLVGALLLLMLVPACGCSLTGPGRSGPGAGGSTADLHGRIDAANRELERRFAAGDMRGVASMYADDAVMLGPGGYRREGRAEIDAYWARITEPVSWDLEVLHLEGDPELPVQRGRSTLRRRVDGELRTSVVEFIVIWRRQEGEGYRIAVDAYW